MDWDIPLWLGILMVCVDGCVAFTMGLWITPRRARRLIVDDDLFVETKARLDEIDKRMEEMDRSSPQLDVKTPIDEALRPLRAEIDAVRAAVNNVTPVIVTAEAEDRIRKSIERAAKAAIKRAIEEGALSMPEVDAGLEDAMNAKAITDELEANRIYSVLVERGLNEDEAELIVSKGARVGKLALAVVGRATGIDFEDVFD